MGTQDTAGELRLQLPRGEVLCLSTRGSTAFQVRLGCRPPKTTPMLAPERPDSKWDQVTSTLGSGIRTGFGALVVSACGGAIYGRGAGERDARELSFYGNVTPVVYNAYGRGSQSLVPHYYSTDGYAALGVSGTSFTTVRGSFLSVTYEAGRSQITWREIREDNLELYFMPAPTLAMGTQAYYDLIGRPRVPPLWTFGFIASRWGWKGKDYVDSTLQHFRLGGYPADAFVVDFEWYTNESDYNFPPTGESYCNDFQFSPTLFPDPSRQLAGYRSELHFRFGGIRKSRVCNSEFLDYAHRNGWILPQGSMDGKKYYSAGRELDFSREDVRMWYAQRLVNLTMAGVSFWWNDEAETSYFTYFWLNDAEERALRASEEEAQVLSTHARRPLAAPRRFWSLNRNFVPGMARLGIGFWTGDAAPEWDVLAAQPGYVLNWALAGAPYVACDIGGFSANTSAGLLMRWYQLGVFIPIMRVHSAAWATPHWPWLWGSEAEHVIKEALELRYRLIPYHYSWAMAMYLGRGLWMQPMAMGFPEEPALANLTHQWLDGQLLVAPVLTRDSVVEVLIPSGKWIPLMGGPPVAGPSTLRSTAGTGDIPAFAPAGCIVPLAPVVQYTEALPGGDLEVRIFPGSDASFTLYEDGGETTAYLRGRGSGPVPSESVRATEFTWTDATRELSWFVSGASDATTLFGIIYALVMDDSGPKRSARQVLGLAGSVAIT